MSENFTAPSLCFCRSGKEYKHCCAPFHLHTAVPETAEQLMRSRYTLRFKKYTLYCCNNCAKPTKFIRDSSIARMG